MYTVTPEDKFYAIEDWCKENGIDPRHLLEDENEGLYALVECEESFEKLYVDIDKKYETVQ